MGKPVLIAEVARLMAARSSRPIGIEITGLRPGEKLHEVLLASDEADLRPAHHLISQVPVPALEPGKARALDIDQATEPLVSDLAQLCRPSGADVAHARPSRSTSD